MYVYSYKGSEGRIKREDERKRNERISEQKRDDPIYPTPPLGQDMTHG